MRIDAHQHFWHYNPDEHVWMTAGMESLKRDFLPDDLAPLLKQTGLQQTIAVQARQNLQETEWLLQLADQNPFIAGVVGWVDLRSTQIKSQLEKYSPHPKLVGVRHVVHDEPDDRFMLQPEFLHGLSLLADFNLVYDLLLFPRHLPVAVEVVQRFPNQCFVLDHIAKPLIRDRRLEPWAADLHSLGRLSNVSCKISGMVTEAAWNGWQAADFRPYLDVVLESFGEDRLMFGSDWPVCTLSADYAEVAAILEAYMQGMSNEAQAKIWGLNAARIYGLSRSPES